MDTETLQYYSSNSVKVAERYEATESALAEYFATAFKKCCRILDIGCGSGRDLSELSRQGFDVYGLDGTRELVELSQRMHPELKGRVTHGLLPSFEPPYGGHFDGVLCSAVLMHLELMQLSPAAASIGACLKKGGRLLISVPSKRPDIDKGDRDSNGRLFVPHSSRLLIDIFTERDFTLLDEWTNEDSLNRQGVEWVSQLYELG